ncbi:MAG: hypothetical protein LBH49_03475 [Puniceicoccales bacterium]|jgi:hypothetical protein|nr:hypothetical protein [Puniceicoccales bacterium]
MSGVGINGNNFNDYNNLSWKEKKQILADANTGNCFTRLFLATKLGSGRSGLNAAMGKSKTLDKNKPLSNRVANRAGKIFTSLAKKALEKKDVEKEGDKGNNLAEYLINVKNKENYRFLAGITKDDVIVDAEKNKIAKDLVTATGKVVNPLIMNNNHSSNHSIEK